MQQLAGSESKVWHSEIEASGVLWGEAPISQLSRHDIYCQGWPTVRYLGVYWLRHVHWSVCPFVCNNLAPIGQIFMKFVLLGLFCLKVCR